MAPKRKITVDLPSTKKGRDRNDRPSNDKSREHSRNSDKDRTEKNTAPDREDSNRSSERERTSNKMSSGNASNMFPNERNSQRDRERDNKDRSGDTTQHRASVFSRLGKGPLNAPSSSNSNTSQQEGICRPWADTGHCPYGNECRFKHISNLVSPSKRPSGSHDTRDGKEKERDGLNRSGGHRKDMDYRRRNRKIERDSSHREKRESSHKGSRERRDSCHKESHERDKLSSVRRKRYSRKEKDRNRKREDNERVENKERHRQSGGDRDQVRTSVQLPKESGRKDALRPGSKMSLAKHNLASKLGGKMKTDSPLIDPNWENWDEDNLDYDDELMLEKKRQLLQRELEKQMAVDGGASADAATIAPGSSIKGQKGATSSNIQTAGLHQPNSTRNKSSNKKSLEDKSSSSSTSSDSDLSSSSSDSGSSSGSSSSTESSDESEVGSTGISKKKDKNKASTSRGMLSSGIGISGSKSGASASTFQSSKHRDRSSRASSISSSETKRKKKDRSGRSSRVGSKKSRNSIGRNKSSTGSKNAGVSKRDKKRPDRKSKNFLSKHSSSKREDIRGKSPSRHGIVTDSYQGKNLRSKNDDDYYEACIWSEVESVATHEQQSETAAEYGSNQMGTEEYSDFDSDSGEELLYDMRDENEEKEAAIQSNNEGENIKDNGMDSNDKEEVDESPCKLQDNYIDVQSNKIEKRNKHDGLLEGISDEELDDVSEEENAEKNGQSAKLADALGVDWSQLVELQQKHKNQEDLEDPTKSTVPGTDEKEAQARLRKKYWTPIAIFNRIGLPRSFLSDSFYNSFVKQLNENAEDGEKLELLHENAGYHMQLKEQRERRKNLFVNGPYSRPMLARQEIAIRRELCGLPKEEYSAMPMRPNTDMELWNKAVELMLDEDDPTSKEAISESNSSSKMTQVF